MTKRVPKQSIVVQRPVGFPDHAKDEKRQANYTPPTGQAFDFTADEVKQIEKMNPDAFGKDAVVDVTISNDGGPIPSEGEKTAPAGATTNPTLASNATKPDAAAKAKADAAAKVGKSDEL